MTRNHMFKSSYHLNLFYNIKQANQPISCFLTFVIIKKILIVSFFHQNIFMFQIPFELFHNKYFPYLLALI